MGVIKVVSLFSIGAYAIATSLKTHEKRGSVHSKIYNDNALAQKQIARNKAKAAKKALKAAEPLEGPKHGEYSSEYFTNSWVWTLMSLPFRIVWFLFSCIFSLLSGVFVFIIVILIHVVVGIGLGCVISVNYDPEFKKAEERGYHSDWSNICKLNPLKKVAIGIICLFIFKYSYMVAIFAVCGVTYGIMNGRNKQRN
jgi:hypothetical protein